MKDKTKKNIISSKEKPERLYRFLALIRVDQHEFLTKLSSEAGQGTGKGEILRRILDDFISNYNK